MEREPVYLHIGASKSGSTWLQRRLHNIRSQLQDVGLLYPGTGVDHYPGVVSLLGIAFGYGETADRKSIEVWESLAKEVREWPHTSLISHEFLSWATPEDVRRCVDTLAPKRVEIIYTLRDLGRVLPSHWQEDVKNNCMAEFDQWIRNLQDPKTTNVYARNFWRFQDPGKALHSWCSIIKPERIHVILVPHVSTSDDTLWHRFAQILEIDPDLGEANNLFRNTSMSWGETEVIRRINVSLQRKLQWKHYDRLVKWMLANRIYGSRNKVNDSEISLPPRYIEWVRSTAQKQKEYLLSSGVHIVGNLEELTPVISEADTGGGPSDAQIASAAIDGLAAVIRKFSAERDKVNAMMAISPKKSNVGKNDTSLPTNNPIRRISIYMKRARRKLFR